MNALQLLKKNRQLSGQKVNATPRKPHCIVWAIDPYEKRLTPDNISLEVLNSRFRGNPNKIFPVYVSSDNHQNKLSPAYKDAYKFLEGIADKTAKKLTVLSAPVEKYVSPVKRLLRYAKSKGAELIAVCSSGKRNIKRLFLGSFAEELLKQSTIPILFLTHRNDINQTSQKVLFATDFSERSKIAYLQFLKFSKNFAYEIILYNLVTDPYFSMAVVSGEMAGIPLYYSSEALVAQREQAEKCSKTWIAFTKKHAPLCEVKCIIQENLSQIAPSILRVADKECVGLIGMSSSVGIFEKTLFGSISQEVFRKQSRPVWVYGPKCKGASK